MTNGQEDKYAFSNLTQSGLMKITSKDDKAVTLTVNAFGGSTSFSIFTSAGGKPWSTSIKRRSAQNIAIMLDNMIADPKPCREQIMLNTWDADNKRVRQVGHLAFGIDENLVFYIDIAHEGLGGNRHIFPIKGDLSMDFSNTSLSEKDNLKAAIMWLKETLLFVSPIAERLTNFKKTFGANSNQGNRGYNNKGGYQSGQNSGRQGSTFGGSDVSETDISF